MDFFWHILIVICVSLPNILGFNLIFGKGKIFHFGPLGVSIVAAYGAFLALLATGSYPIALLSGLLASFCISMVFAWMSLRLEPDGFGVMSIAMHLGIIAVVLNWISLTRGARGLPRIPRFEFLESMQTAFGLSPMESFALLSFVLCVVWTTFIWFVDRGPLGRQLSALAEHAWHGESLGIDRRKVHVAVFAIGSVGALITNVLYHQYIALVHYSDFGFPAFIFFIMVVVAGKPGSVLGTVTAGTLLVLLREGLRFVPLAPSILGPMRLILFGVILFVVVWWRRDVLFPKQRTV